MKATLISRLHSMGLTYRQYLDTPHWQDVRRRYRESDLPQECLGCGEGRYELHHRSYCRLGNELLTDLIPLCRDCHSRVHVYEQTHSTNLTSTHKILRMLFGWSRAYTREKLMPFCPRPDNLSAMIPENAFEFMTNKQRLRELRRADPDNPAFWTAKQKRRAGLID